MVVLRLFLLFPLLFHFSDGKSIVFQGTCADAGVVCDQLCVTLNPETYECSCWNDHILQSDGISCRLNITYEDIQHEAEEKSHPLVVDIIPDIDDSSKSLSFHGNNYAEFPVVESAYLETNITIEFRIHGQRDGILFFAGQTKGDDFLSISLIGPNIMLRQDCGEGTIEDLYRGPFDEDIWHNITVTRKYCFKTEIRADRKKSMVDYASQFTNYKGISMDEGIFVGGAPRTIVDLDDKAGTDRGFSGCIRKVIVNEVTLLDTAHDMNTATNQKTLSKCGKREKTIQQIAEEFLEFDIATGVEEHQSNEQQFNSMSLRNFTFPLKPARTFNHRTLIN